MTTKQKNLLILVLLLIASLFAIFAIFNETAILMASVIPMATIGNINDVNDREVAGNSLSTRVWFVSIDQINRDVQFPKPTVNREVANLPLRTGQYWHYIEAHTYPTDEGKIDKGDLTITSSNSFKMVAGSNSVQLMNFIENHAGGKFIIVYYDFLEDLHYMLGSLHYPMVLKNATRSKNKEKKAVEFEFANESFIQPYVYVGQLKTSAPIDVAGVSIPVNPSSCEYNLTGTAAVTTTTGITANDVGRSILVTGTKGATIAETATFILHGGVTWTANPGSKIEFKIYDSQPTLIEIPNSRTQAV